MVESVTETQAVAPAVFGQAFFAGTRESAAALVCDRARSGAGGYACLCNVHVLMEAKGNETLGEVLAGAWRVFPDGAPIAWLQRRSGLRADRIAGPDLFVSVMDAGRAYGLRHYLFGGSESVLSSLESEIVRRFPGVVIAGKVAPPRADVVALGGSWIDLIRSADADIVWCGLGAPKQELWMREHAPALQPALVLGVGAAFDFVSGTKARAPQWMQAAGLEWVHRVAREPRRLFWRYATTNARFVRALPGALRSTSGSGRPVA